MHACSDEIVGKGCERAYGWAVRIWGQNRCRQQLDFRPDGRDVGAPIRGGQKELILTGGGETKQLL